MGQGSGGAAGPSAAGCLCSTGCTPAARPAPCRRRSPAVSGGPIYLPDGHILFTTTRGNSYVRCGPFIYSYILARCDADGRNVYLISHNGEPDFVPALLNDGRVVYSRWEYTDKPLWRLQKLWTTNQDGTGTAHLWGNQSVWPDHLSEPRPIPGSRRVMFSGVGHHDWWSGSIGIVDPDQGRDYLHRLIAWVDACCPFMGEEEVRQRPAAGTAPFSARENEDRPRECGEALSDCRSAGQAV